MSNTYDRCPNCMNPYDGSGNPCPYCGQDVVGYVEPKNCLPPFTVLQNKYMIGRVLGQGGFGITYVGYDMNLATYVAVKEYYPESISARGLADNPLLVTAQTGKEEIYNKNLNRFVDEARNLSKFYSLPGIVSVRNFFYENGTAYIVMDYVAGSNLKKYLADNGGRLDEGTVLSLMKPVLESLYEVHKQGLIHRDISPDNIMFDDDGSIKLIDFGAVRGSSAETEMTYTVMLKHGYAPQEQYYTKGNQGPWTDIYSLCATMYKMLTGNVPPNCIERMSEDTYIPPSYCGVAVSEGVEKALAKGLAVNIADRYQNIGELIKDLYGKEYTFMGDGQIGVTRPVNDMMVNGNKNVSSNGKGNGVNNGNKKLIPVICGLAALLLICVVLGVLLNKKEPKDKPSTTVATATDATTEAVSETTTEAVTEETTGATTEATTEVKEIEYPGNWTDFKFMIDGEEYVLPMTNSEWVARGWKTDSPNYEIYPGQLKEIIYYDEKVACGVVLTNYTDQVVKIEDSYVIGFQFYNDVHITQGETVITLPGDVVLNSTDSDLGVNMTHILSAYGEPTDKNENEVVQQYRYFDDNRSSLILRCWAGAGLYRVSYTNYMAPEGSAFASCGQVETVAMNEAYQAPGQTADRWDDICTFDGVNYKLPCPVSSFIENGWSMESDVDNLPPGLMSSVVLKKGSTIIEVTLANYTVFELMPEQLYVQNITVSLENSGDMDITFPGGVKLGMEISKVKAMYEDCSGYDDTNEKGQKTYYTYEYVPDGKISATYVKGTGEDGIERVVGITYDHSQVSRESNDDNRDYITGTMVEQN